MWRRTPAVADPPLTTARHGICLLQAGQSYRISQRIRKRIEEHFGWMKAVGPMGRAKLRGRAKMACLLRQAWLFTFSAAVSNLVRLPGLSAAPS